VKPFLAALGALLIAGCAGTYQAPVVDRSVSRPPAAPVDKAERRPETYTVKSGDTLYSIALNNGVDHKELAAWNGISDPTLIRPGQTLTLRPPAATAPAPTAPVQAAVQVQPAIAPGAVEVRPLGSEPRPRAEAPRIVPELLKTGPKAVKLPYSEENLAMLQRQSPPPVKPEPGTEPQAPLEGADSVAWIWPAAGRVLAGFSEASNKGLDIVGKIGDPVYASASGRVVFSGTARGYGKLVIIKHNETYLSAYAHNSNVLVKEGQNVVRGQKIAEIGNTDSSQAKLHFEIRRQGKPVDPLKLLPARPS
jgi:lipoprotein NlpD